MNEKAVMVLNPPPIVTSPLMRVVVGTPLFEDPSNQAPIVPVAGLTTPIWMPPDPVLITTLRSLTFVGVVLVRLMLTCAAVAWKA